MYRSEYVNCTLAGSTPDGERFAFVAGKHQQNFPYYTRESKWDSVLVLIGGDAYAISDRDLPGLAFDLDLHGADAGTAHIRFEGALRAADGRQRQGRLRLAVGFQRFPAFHLGQPFSAAWMPGLVWTPFQLRALPGAQSTLAVDGATRTLSTLCGELEHGAFANLACRPLAIAYDYVALACSTYAYVAFETHPLYHDGLVGKGLEWYLARSAAKVITLSDGALHGGNPRGAHGDGVEVILTDTVHLGLADLDRQLVSSSDADGTPLFGLREIFRAR